MKIVAGVVLFNPNIDELVVNLKSISSQVDEIIIVDNASLENEFIMNTINKLFANIFFIKNDTNLGVAKALNQICELAYQKKYEWVLLLDQDTLLPYNYVDFFSKLKIDKKVAILTPKITDNKINITYDDSESIVGKVSKCITSGSVNNLNYWKQLKGFDENIFIDGVDHDYCYRVINQGLIIEKHNSIAINHRIGSAKEKNFFGKSILIFSHAPNRKYYIIRNIIYLNRKHHFSKLRSIIQIIKQYLIVILFEDDKIEKIKSMDKGVLDGIKKE